MVDLELPCADLRHAREQEVVVDVAGAPTAFGRAWMEDAAVERERRTPTPWPRELDVESYYANLPDSAADLYAEWRRGGSDRPAMLG